MSLSRYTERPICTVRMETSLTEASRRMIDHSVGCLVITDPDGREVLGIVTDRDIVWMVAEGLDPTKATVGGLSKGPVTCIPVHATLAEAADLMHKRGVRRLPIIDADGRLTGIIALDDILIELSRELHNVANAVGEEISHERSITGDVSGRRSFI